MPYVPPGTSQACLPRKAVSNSVLEQTRRKAGGKTGVRSYRPEKQAQAQAASEASSSLAGPSSRSGAEATVDTAAATALLAERLEVAHIDQPAVPAPQPAPASLAPSSQSEGRSPPSISPTLSEGDAKSHTTGSSDSEDPVTAYKASLLAYTRNLMNAAKNPPKEEKKGLPGYSQFGSKQSGMQKIAAKKALARQLNA